MFDNKFREKIQYNICLRPVMPRKFKGKKMEKKKHVYWQDEDMWVGYLEEYPDYWTQGKTLEELKDNLKDIY